MNSFLLVILLVVAPPDRFADGMAAYTDGRFADAVLAFQEAAQESGDQTSPEVYYNLALAALGAGELTLAETAAERAAARGGQVFLPRRDFVLGNAAFLRADIACAACDIPGAKPEVFDNAVTLTEGALRHWAKAVVGRADWPEARRNAARALLKIEDLKRKKDVAAKNPEGSKKVRSPKPEPRNDGPTSPENSRPPDPKNALRPPELSPDQTRRLLEKLRAKKAEKTKQREKAQAERTSGSEKDW